MLKTSFKAFTLVELIIVITILAILATISFVSFNGYITQARDSKRLTTLNSVEKSLQLYELKTSKYPEPENMVGIYLSGELLVKNGYITENLGNTLSVKGLQTDEITQKDIIYATNYNNKSYQLLGYFEKLSLNLGNNFTYANDFSTKTIGMGAGILTQNGELISSDVDLYNTSSGEVFQFYIPGTEVKTETGFNLLGIEMLAKKGGNFEAPKSCPEGFIPVVGSSEFYQPGFCVAKYEMGYEGVDIPDSYQGGTDRNTVGYNSVKVPVSSSGNLPITDISFPEAILSCEKIGGHLITNNEWMTIARQIENNGKNWSSGKFGSGYIYNGNSNTSYGCSGETNTIYSGLYRTRGAKTGIGGNIDCDSKRQLVLPNGEVIWDFSGNVREQVNKANTISGIGYNIGTTTIEGCQNNGNNSEFVTCDDNNYGPEGSYDSNNAMGMVYYSRGTNNNILLRGGYIVNSPLVGIYQVSLYNINTDNFSIGFRCAY